MSDKNGLAQAKTSLTSLLINTKKRNFDIIFLTCSKINRTERKWFDQKKIQIVYFKLETSANKYFRDIYFTVFYLFKKEILKNWKHVVFVETDTLIVGDIKELFKLEGFYATQNSGNTYLKAQFMNINNILRNIGPNLRKQRTVDQMEITKVYNDLTENYDLNNKPTFNAGVFVFSTNSLEGFDFNNALKIVEKYSMVSRYGMQGPLNLIFYMSWKKLPKKYNFLINLERKISSVRSLPTVIHFAGAYAEQKPWNNKYHILAPLWFLYSFMSTSHDSSLSGLLKYMYSLFPRFFNRVVIEAQLSFIPIILGKIKRRFSYNTKLFILDLRRAMIDLIIRFIFKPCVNLAIILTVIFLKRKRVSKELKPNAIVYYQCSDSDFLITIASILGFDNFCKNVSFTIHKNTYTVFDKIILRRLNNHVNIRILTKKDIEKLSASLAKYPKTKDFFDYGWSGTKCILPLLEKNNIKTILLDSDVLFYNNLEEILEWLNTEKKYNIYLQDFKRFSVISDVEAKYILGRKLKLKPVNSGLIGFNLDLFPKPKIFKDIEKFIKEILEINNTRLTSDTFLKSRYFSTFPLLEQSIHWLLLENSDTISLPVKDYKVFPPHSLYGKDIAGAKCIHYTGDQKRFFIYRHLFYMLADKILSKKRSPKPWYCYSSKCYRCNHPQAPYWY